MEEIEDVSLTLSEGFNKEHGKLHTLLFKPLSGSSERPLHSLSPFGRSNGSEY